MKAVEALLRENTSESLLIALGVGLGSFVIVKWLVRLVARRIKTYSQTTSSWWDDVLSDVLNATSGLAFAFLGLYVSASQLVISVNLQRTIDHVLIVVLLLQAGLWGQRAIASWIHHRTSEERERGNGGTVANLGIVRVIAQMVLWIIIALLTLDNLGFNITALVASLGIGGVAIALALQNILGDLFASLSIAMDKPFVVGDFIIVDEHAGTVKNVGLKTTRVQSLSGEELVFSNGDLLKSRIRNYKRMAERRIVFAFGISYGSSAAQIEQANRIVEEAIKAQEFTRFDRVHFKTFAASSLDFEAVYYMLDPDYACYMRTQQAINLCMLEEFAKAEIEFAFPTQTIHIASMPEFRGAQPAAPAQAPG